MRESLGTQSNFNYLALLAIGTASFLSPMNQYTNFGIEPSKNYSLHLNVHNSEKFSNFDYEYKLSDYHSDNFLNEQNLMEMKIIGKRRIKIKVAVPLKFESIEDANGFIV